MPSCDSCLRIASLLVVNQIAACGIIAMPPSREQLLIERANRNVEAARQSTSSVQDKSYNHARYVDVHGSISGQLAAKEPEEMNGAVVEEKSKESPEPSTLEEGCLVQSQERIAELGAIPSSMLVRYDGEPHFCAEIRFFWKEDGDLMQREEAVRMLWSSFGCQMPTMVSESFSGAKPGLVKWSYLDGSCGEHRKEYPVRPVLTCSTPLLDNQSASVRLYAEVVNDSMPLAFYKMEEEGCESRGGKVEWTKHGKGLLRRLESASKENQRYSKLPKVRADDLLRDYSANELAASEKYERKWIRLVGVVMAVRKSGKMALIELGQWDDSIAAARLPISDWVREIHVGETVEMECFGKGLGSSALLEFDCK